MEDPGNAFTDLDSEVMSEVTRYEYEREHERDGRNRL